MANLSIVPKPAPTRYLSTAETAKLMRKALQAAFPDLPKSFFSVRSSVYSGGSSIRVCWTDGPAAKLVDELLWPFRSTSFDGMTDSTIHIPTALTLPDGTTAKSGAGYVFTSRELSPKADAILTAKAKSRFGWDDIVVRGGFLQKKDGLDADHSDRVWFSHLSTALSLAPNGVAFWNKEIGAPYL